MPARFSRMELVGDKVRLRPIQASDAVEVCRLLSDDAVVANLTWEGPVSEAEMAEIYRDLEGELKSGESCCFTIERVDASGLLGRIDARFPHHPWQVEIGYWLGVPYWNQGYMTEAVRLVCHFSFVYLNAPELMPPFLLVISAVGEYLRKTDFPWMEP